MAAGAGCEGRRLTSRVVALPTIRRFVAETKAIHTKGSSHRTAHPPILSPTDHAAPQRASLNPPRKRIRCHTTHTCAVLTAQVKHLWPRMSRVVSRGSNPRHARGILLETRWFWIIKYSNEQIRCIFQPELQQSPRFGDHLRNLVLLATSSSQDRKPTHPNHQGALRDHGLQISQVMFSQEGIPV